MTDVRVGGDQVSRLVEGMREVLSVRAQEISQKLTREFVQKFEEELMKTTVTVAGNVMVSSSRDIMRSPFDPVTINIHIVVPSDQQPENKETE